MNIFEDKISFHDTSIVGINQEKDYLILEIEDVHLGDDQFSINVTVSNIESITRDDLQTTHIEMETNDGEVLQFSAEDNCITLVVTWHRHTPHTQDTHIYQISGKRLKLDIDRSHTPGFID